MNRLGNCSVRKRSWKILECRLSLRMALIWMQCFAKNSLPIRLNKQSNLIRLAIRLAPRNLQKHSEIVISFVLVWETSFDFLSETSTMRAVVWKCKWGNQNIYAGDLACNKGLANPLSNYKYTLLTMSSTLDADYYHQYREPLINIE